LRFKGNLPQLQTLLFFRDLLRERYEKDIAELFFTVTDKSGIYWKDKSKKLKFSDSAIKKFQEALAIANEKIIVDFELLRNLENAEYKSRDVDFSIIYKQDYPINSLNLIFNASIYRNAKWKKLVEEVHDFLLKQKCPVVYGFVLALDNLKNPALYVEGVGSPSLNSRERDKVNAWTMGMMDCETKIWDVFWGNMISEKHLRSHPNVLSEISKIVGNENFSELHGGLYWFNLDYDIEKFDNSIFDEKRESLYSLFNRADKILTTNGVIGTK